MEGQYTVSFAMMVSFFLLCFVIKFSSDEPFLYVYFIIFLGHAMFSNGKIC